MNNDLISLPLPPGQLDGLSDTRLIKRNFVALVTNAPTADAVPVVRCRECKFGTHFGDMEDEWINCTNLNGKPLMPFDGFCSHGEREEGAD